MRYDFSWAAIIFSCLIWGPILTLVVASILSLFINFDWLLLNLILLTIFEIWLIILPLNKKLRLNTLKKELYEINNHLSEVKNAIDKQYDRIINCPKCKGNGECIMVHIEDVGSSGIRRYKRIASPPDLWKLDGAYKESGKEGYELPFRERYNRESCPYCKGNGIAYAYYEKSSENCEFCGGKGTVNQQHRMKFDIGSENKIETIVCRHCNGVGKKEEIIINVKTLNEPTDLTDNKYRFSITSHGDGYEYYLKSKPRF